MELSSLYKTEIENQMLADCMKDLTIFKKVKLSKEDFFEGASQFIYEILRSLENNGYSTATFSDLLIKGENLNPNKYKAYETYLTCDGMRSCYKNPNLDNYLGHYDTLKKYSILRKLFKMGIDISEFYSSDLDFPDEKHIALREKFESASVDELYCGIKAKYDDIFTSAYNLIGEEVNPFITIDFETINEKLEPLIDGIFYKKTFNNVNAPSKAGKTQFCYQMAYCIQNGIDFLGYKVDKNDVLYLDFELQDFEILERYESLKKHIGIEDTVAPKFMSLTGTSYHLDEIVQEIKMYLMKNRNIKVIFWDNFYSFFEGNSNDGVEVKKALQKLKCIDKELTSIIVSHQPKAEAAKGGSDDPLNGTAGSFAFGAFCDDAIGLKPSKSSNKIEVLLSGRHNYGTTKILTNYGPETDFYFDLCTDYVPDGLSGFHKTPEKLQEEYPELYDIIKDGATLKAIQEDFPDETQESLEEKGFWYSGRNKDRLKNGFKTMKFYVNNPKK